jgi:hypothetical protein
MPAIRRVVVSYRIKPGNEDHNEALVRAVYSELHAAAPAGFRYATFKLDDALTFVHFASTETEDGQSPLPGLDAFKAFQAGIRERCEWGPIVSEVEEIGSYRVLDG